MRTETDFEPNESLHAFREMQELSIRQEAEVRLNLLGLRLEDLKSYKKVLDLGAGLCHVERAARLAGIENVVSAGLNKPKEAAGLNFRQFDAFSEMPFERDEFDLVLTRKGPFFLSQTKPQAMSLLSRVASISSKEVRINPLHFGYIKEDMFQEFPEYAEINSKPRTQRNPLEIQRWKEYNLVANQRTQDDLLNRGLAFEVIHADAGGVKGIEEDDFGYILFANNAK